MYSSILAGIVGQFTPASCLAQQSLVGTCKMVSQVRASGTTKDELKTNPGMGKPLRRIRSSGKSRI